MSRKYATKSEIFAAKVAAAKKAEAAALYYIEEGSVAGNHIWDLARKLWAEANAYSIRWSLKSI